MNKQVHRALTTILASLTGISALLAATDPAALQVGATAWAWTALALSVGAVVVTAARQAWEAEA